MLDIKFIRENPKIVKKNLEKRNEKEKIKWIDDLLKKDKEYRKLLKKSEELKHKRNITSQKINELKKQGKTIEKELKEIKGIPEKIKENDKKLKELKEKIRFYLLRIPNILEDEVPIGKDSSDNKVIKKCGKIKKFDFKLKSHGEIIERLGGDFERARKIAGAGFYYLKDKIALLDLALQRFAIDFLMKRGYCFIEPPFMMKRQAYEGAVSLDDFKNVMYKIENQDLYMIATAEHPISAMFMNETLYEEELPIKFCGLSACFRKEIGSHGIDTKGLFRVHQFNKVEQFIFCKPEESKKLHQELQENSEQLYQLLEIPYRVVDICTGDIGSIAKRKFDLEAYSPREKAYFEVGSNSNCGSYQAVRLNIRLRRKNGIKEYVHTLNNTAIATSRAIRAILENYQQKDGTIAVPKVLQKYIGAKVIGGKNGKKV